MDEIYRELFFVGRKYRVLEDFLNSRFKKGEELIYKSGGWSRYDGCFFFFFCNEEGVEKECWAGEDTLLPAERAKSLKELQARFAEVFEHREVCPLESFLIKHCFDQYSYRVNSLANWRESGVTVIKRNSDTWHVFKHYIGSYDIDVNFKSEEGACRFFIDKILEDPKNHMDYETKGEAYVLELYKKIRESKEYENYLSLEIPVCK